MSTGNTPLYYENNRNTDSTTKPDVTYLQYIQHNLSEASQRLNKLDEHL